jgi:hypothetical protein
MIHDEPVTVTNNEGLLTYTFTENGSFTFEFTDADGNKGTATATVNNIDKSPPVMPVENKATVENQTQPLQVMGNNATIYDDFTSDSGLWNYVGSVVHESGYGIEFDSYPLNSGDNRSNHIALIKDSASNHLVISDNVYASMVLTNGRDDLHAAKKCQVQLDNAYSQPALAATASIILGDSQTEILGTAEVEVDAVTLLAPAEISQFSLKGSGQAPPSSTVQVFDSDVLPGTAESSGNGFWQLSVTLPDTGNTRCHSLQAKAQTASAMFETYMSIEPAFYIY